MLPESDGVVFCCHYQALGSYFQRRIILCIMVADKQHLGLILVGDYLSGIQTSLNASLLGLF
jgi:hypothetical protein